MRYNQGGYPSVAFLTADGEFLAGRPYTPPEEMAALLMQVSSGEFSPENGLATRPTGQPGRAAAGGSVDAVYSRLVEIYRCGIWRLWRGTQAATVGGAALPHFKVRPHRRQGRAQHD